MLDSFLKNRETKALEKVEDHFKKALEFVEGKLYKQAMIEFKHALELDRERVYERLVAELENFSRSGNSEGALAVGLNLLKDNTTDYELANKLGNFSRELGDYKQASNLYKHALKINKKFEFAKFNLAAAMARVDKFDDEAIGAVTKFDNIVDFILPEYHGDSEIIDRITQELMEKNKDKQEETMQGVILEKEKMESSAEPDKVQLEKLEAQIQSLKNKKVEVSPDDILQYFKQLMGEDKERAVQHTYNLGLYALTAKKPKVAQECFGKLSNSGTQFDYLKLNLALADALDGKNEDAINALIKLLGVDRYNRYYNVNLGLLYRNTGNKLLAFKYLILSAWLLERSDGKFNLTDLIKSADEKFAAGKVKEALRLYKIAAGESKNPHVYENIGLILIQQKKLDEAVMAFRKLQEVDPESTAAKEKLKEVHDFYVSKADGLFREIKYKPAADNYQRALAVLRLPDTIKQAAAAYKQLKNAEKEQELMDEWYALMEEKKNEALENERLDFIIKAKESMKTKQYLKAVDLYENAFRMKLDKDVFLALAALYKGMKKGADLQSLLERWNKMVEHDEKMKKYEKLQERTQQKTE